MLYKDGFTLTEVLVSVILLSVVIMSILQMQQNSLNFLEKHTKSSLNDSYISFIVEQGENRNNEVFLSDKVKFEDDDIRKEFKEIKIKIKDEASKDIPLPENDYIQNMKSFKTTYSIDDKYSKIFFTFKIE